MPAHRSALANRCVFSLIRIISIHSYISILSLVSLKFLDIILLIPLLWGAYRGYKKGLLLEIVAIFALVLGVIGGFKLLHWGIHTLTNFIGDYHKLIPVLAFILIFISIVILVNILGKALKKVLDYTLLGSLDNFSGALVGLIKWAFGLSIILWLVQLAGIVFPEDATAGTFLFPFMVNLAPMIIAWFALFLPFIQDLMDSIKDLLQI